MTMTVSCTMDQDILPRMEETPSKPKTHVTKVVLETDLASLLLTKFKSTRCIVQVDRQEDRPEDQAVVMEDHHLALTKTHDAQDGKVIVAHTTTLKPTARKHVAFVQHLVLTKTNDALDGPAIVTVMATSKPTARKRAKLVKFLHDTFEKY